MVRRTGDNSIVTWAKGQMNGISLGRGDDTFDRRLP